MNNKNTTSLQVLGSTVQFDNLFAVIQHHLELHPEREVVIFLADGEQETARLSYRQLDNRARAIAAQLQQTTQSFGTLSRAEGDKPRALLAFNNGIEFIVSFYACLYAGVCAVPVYPPQHRASYLQRLELIATDCQAEFILGMGEYLSKVKDSFAEFPTLSTLVPIAADTVAEQTASAYQPQQISATDLAFLQYTSGSTSAPKGVMVTHQNLLHNIMCMQQRFAHSERDVIVSWLPMFHDMGLIGVVLQAICIAAVSVVMIPAAFLQKPLRWLYAVTKYRGTSTFAPNFAFDLCVDRATPADIAALDLSSWLMALNGAEPIRAQTLTRFAATFAPAGFAANTLYPGYGLAEATLFVSGSPKGRGPVYLDVDAAAYQQKKVRLVTQSDADSIRLVSSGQPSDLHQLLIVDPEHQLPCTDGDIGEIWLSSPSVAQGYWRNTAQTAEVFQARLATASAAEASTLFMRTGDYGFIWQQQLYIVGRIKDVIIIRGANYYPQALEEALQRAIPGLKDNGGAAFSIEVSTGLATGEQLVDEKLVIVQEVERTWVRKLNTAQVFAKARQVISEEFGLQLHDLVLLNPATLAKTSSGKIQRRKSKAQYQQQELAVFARLEPIAVAAPAEVLPVAETLTAEEQALCTMLQLVLATQAKVAVHSVLPTMHITSLGLDSLALVGIAQTLQLMTGVELSTEQLLVSPRLLDIARFIINTRQQTVIDATADVNGTTDATSADTSAAAAMAEDACEKKPVTASPLSLNQQQLYLLYEKDPSSSAYHVPLCLTGHFDAGAVQAAIEQLAAQHPVLRCRIALDEQQQLQQTFTAPAPVLTVHPLKADVTDGQRLQQIQADSLQPFTLLGGALCRFSLWHSDGSAYLLLNMHHIVIDMVSMLTLIEQLLGLLSGQVTQLPVPAQSYQNFVRQQASLDNPQAQTYWQQQLAASVPVLQWPLQQARPARQLFCGSSLDFALTAETCQGLRLLARQQQTTLNTVLLSLYQVFLAKLCYQREFAIGVLNAGRPNTEYQQVLGYFVQPAVFRVALRAGQHKADLLQQTQQQMLQIIKHQQGALAALLQHQPQESLAGVPPVFQTLFTYYADTALGLMPFNASAEQTTVRAFPQFAVQHLPSPGAQLDLSLLCAEYDQQLCCRFEYNTALFSDEQICQFAVYLSNVADQFASNGCDTLAQIALRGQRGAGREEARIPSPMQTDAAMEYPLVAAQIWRNMQQYAGQPAVCCDDEQLSYAELQRRVQPLLQQLLTQTAAGDVVAIAAYRSVDMIVAILAVLGAGCAYLPLDPQQPAERLQYCLKTAKPRLVLTQAATEAALTAVNSITASPWPLLSVSQPVAQVECSPSIRPVSGDDPAYVIFTSGSTGQPKGVVNSQAGLANRLGWMASHYQIGSDCRILQKTPYTFDVSVWELLLPLLSGGCLVFARPEGHKDVSYLTGLIAAAAVDRLHFVPSMLEVFVDEISQAQQPLGSLASLKQVFCSGEALSKHLQQRFHQVLPACELHNLYGPTEAAIDVTAWHCQAQDSYLTVPIGHSISQLELYALDLDGMPVPPGVTGELFISGIGLAQGYINKPELTAERFVINPFACPHRTSDQSYRRMYQSGDLVRYQPAGVIEYLGRTDSQVKVRGFRIELAEVDARVVQLPAVREAVSLVSGQGGTARLICYVVLHEQAAATTTAQLRTALSAVLPEYMLPDLFVTLTQMPLNANGKLDRKALPAVAAIVTAAQEDAANAEEAFVLQCFAELLQLQPQQLGRQSHFFQSGGHSLSAARLVQRLNLHYGSAVQLRDIFNAPTVAAIAGLLQSPLRAEAGLTLTPGGTLRQLSSSQSRLWFHHRLEGASGVYNIPLILQFATELEPAALQQSVDALLQRHPLLRAVYQAGTQDSQHGEMWLSSALSCQVRQQCLQTEAELLAALDQASEAPFALEQELPIRLACFHWQQRSYLLICLHHIVADAQTMDLVVRELSDGYQRALQAEPQDLTCHAIGYQSFVDWQQQWLQSPAAEQQLTYWRQQLADLPPLLELPCDHARPVRLQSAGDSIRFQLEPILSRQLQKVAAAHDVSLYMLLLSVFSVLLARVSRQTDLAIGTPVFGRPDPALDQVVGYFANTLVIRQQLGELHSMAQLLASTKEQVMAAYEHQWLPFEVLVEQLKPERNLSYSPLFQVMFGLSHPSVDPDVFAGEAQLMLREHQLAKFDLSLMLEVSGSPEQPQLGGYLEFATALFERSTMQQWLSHYQQLLHSVCQADTQQLQVDWRTLAMLSPGQQQHACKLGAGHQLATQQHNLLQRFYQSYLQATDHVAVTDLYGNYCYRQLAGSAWTTAQQLLAAGVQPAEPVLLATSADVSRIVALLAIQMAGACYVPVDPANPAQRNQWIARQTNARVLLHSVGQPAPAGLADANVQLLAVEQMLPEQAETAGSEAGVLSVQDFSQLPGWQLDSAAPVYLMFTSGSTGEPKGTLIPQRGVLRLVTAASFMQLDDSVVFLQAAPLAFDASTLEIWGPLLNAGRLVISAEAVLSADTLRHLISGNGINAAWLTSSLFNHLTEQDVHCVAGLRQLLVGGDVVSPAHVAKVYQANSDIQLINGYGPTETTTFAVCYPIPRTLATGSSVPVGLPIQQTQLYIVDEQLQLVPEGVAGELLIGGDGVALAYLGRPELTAEKFIADPFAGHGLLYRSGDIVRRDNQGVLHFIGRADQQIKLRGFRIELTEISEALLRLPAVLQAAAVVSGSAQHKQLIAYVVLQQQADEATTGDATLLQHCRQLQQQLKQALPAYLIPAAILPLPTLPLTVNGKLDQRALPQVHWSQWQHTDYQSPQTETEWLLAQCWAELFRLAPETISRHADFFQLGGHSLLVARLCHWVSQHCQKSLPLATVFASPTLAALAQQVEQSEPHQATALCRQPQSEQLELSYAQQRLLFIEQSGEPTAVYNVPLFLWFEHGVQADRLQQALQLLLERHQVLRTLYPRLGEDNQARLVSLPTAWLQQTAWPSWLDAQALTGTAELPVEWVGYLQQFAARPFSLTSEIPVRAQWLSAGAGSGLLMLCFHHIAFDGWSQQLFLRQLALAYNQQLQFDAQPLQYQDYAHWQRQQHERDQQQLTYWRQQLQGLPPLLELQTEQSRPVWRQFDGDCLPVQVPAELQQQLTQFCRQHSLTPYMVLLSTFWILLAKHSGEQDIAVGSPVANRQQAELAELAGFFANTVVLRGLLEQTQDVLSLLAQARTTVLAAQANQDVPFEKVVEALNPPRSTAYSPLFQVMFGLMQQSAACPSFADTQVRPLEVPHLLAKFDLSLMLHSQAEQLGGYLEYNSQLFSRQTVSTYWQHYLYLLEQMLAQPEVQLSQLRLVPAADALAQQLAHQPAALAFIDETLPQAFCRQVRQQPQAIALVCHGQHWTYQQLLQSACQLALQLQQAGVRSGEPVAVYLPRQADLIVSLLAIQLAGGFYVPLDPHYPIQRSRNIVSSAQPSLLLTTEHLQPVVRQFCDCPSLVLNGLLWQESVTLLELPAALASVQREPEQQPAYAIYTSGSTGLPKGILIHQRNLMSMLRWAEHQFEPKQRKHILAATSICFDLSVFEIFLPLVTGGCLTLVQDALSLLDPLCLQVQDQAAAALCGPISLINTVPSALDVLVAAERLPVSINTVNLAGEPLSRSLVDRIYALPHVNAVYNLYGPSEDTTYSTCYLVPRDHLAADWHDKPLIGQVIANSRAYILDQGGNLLPDGVAGELWLAGEGVAHGYLGQPELSAKVFRPDPYHPTAARMYRTGDKVRRLPSGMLDYLGRLDFQVKLRGFRIELGEIEAVAAQVAAVREAVAVVHRRQGEHLVLFVLPQSAVDSSGLPQQISQHLATLLPDYMQPTLIELCQQFPTLPNGKIDRSSLQQCELSSLQHRHYEAAATPTESWLADIWQQLLQQSQISRHDNFFELGGHSLLATQLVTRIRQHCGVELPVRKIFQCAELKAQAAAVDLFLASQKLAQTVSQSEVEDMETGTL